MRSCLRFSGDCFDSVIMYIYRSDFLLSFFLYELQLEVNLPHTWCFFLKLGDFPTGGARTSIAYTRQKSIFSATAPSHHKKLPGNLQYETHIPSRFESRLFTLCIGRDTFRFSPSLSFGKMLCARRWCVRARVLRTGRVEGRVGFFGGAGKSMRYVRSTKERTGHGWPLGGGGVPPIYVTQTFRKRG